MTSHNECQWHTVIKFHKNSDMNIGQRIRQEREAQGMTRTELARKADIKYPTLAGIENGDQTASTRLHAIASALGVSVDWLESGKGPKAPLIPTSQPARIDADTISDAQEALRAIARINGLPEHEELAWISDPARLAIAIEAVLDVKSRGARPSNIIDLAARMAQRIRQGETDAVSKTGHGRGNPAAKTTDAK